MTQPYLLIHTAPWCGACKSLMAPSTFSKITEIIRGVNPSTQIKIISHENYSKTNKVEEYPPVNCIPGFPMLMITSSDNCNRRGTMDKCKIYNYKWDGSKLVEISKNSKESIKSWLERELNPSLFKQTNKEVRSSSKSTSQVDRVSPHVNKNKRTFRLVGENDLY